MQQKTFQMKREIEEFRCKQVADTEIARLQVPLHQTQEQQLRERDASQRDTAEAITREAGRLRQEAAFSTEAVTARARQEDA